MSERLPLLRRAAWRAWRVLYESARFALGLVLLYWMAVGIGVVYEAGWKWMLLLIGWPILGFVVLVWVLYEGGNVGPGRR